MRARVPFSGLATCLGGLLRAGAVARRPQSFTSADKACMDYSVSRGRIGAMSRRALPRGTRRGCW